MGARPQIPTNLLEALERLAAVKGNKSPEQILASHYADIPRDYPTPKSNVLKFQPWWVD